MTTQREQALTALLKDEIQQKGPITFADFMQFALYHPQLGYYAGQSNQFGETGDFTTAPELSPLFGQCLAEQCAQVLTLTNGDILEFGAGRGKLAVDILRRLESLKNLPNHYYILDISNALVTYQKEFIKKELPHLHQKVVWIKTLPEKFKGIILANEVLDAMPVHRFHYENGEVDELFINCKNNGFFFEKHAPSPALSAYTNRLKSFCTLCEGIYESEINLHLDIWFQELFSSVQTGVILLIDYGFPEKEFYHPERHTGTVMCHYRHHAHPDPFVHIGSQDITAHVDFTAVAHSAYDAGFDIAGFTNQANFLIACHLMNLLESPVSTAEHFLLTQAVKKLTLPSEMGELFKVIALAKGIDKDLLGFESTNQLERL